jgi:fumarate hydratase subunit alpha
VDTGVPVFFVNPSRTMPQDLPATLADAVADATARGILKPSVADPFTGEITPDNIGEGVPCIIYGQPREGPTEVTYFPNACASDKLATIAHIRPPLRDEDVIAAIRKTVSDGKGRLCQPIIVGVGIGGTADVSMMLSKAALLRPVGSESGNAHARKLERQALESINEDGAGVNALALAVHIEVAAAHRVTCPISINLLCRAARRTTLRVSDTGEVQVV